MCIPEKKCEAVHLFGHFVKTFIQVKANQERYMDFVKYNKKYFTFRPVVSMIGNA